MADGTVKVGVSTGDGRRKFRDVTVPVVDQALALDATDVGVAADDQLTGAIPCVFRLSIANQASGDVDYVVTHAVRVIDAWCVKEAADGHASEDTITVENGDTAITDAMAIGNPDDTGVTRAATINDATQDIAAGGTLRIAVARGASGGNNTQCQVYVLGLRVE